MYFDHFTKGIVCKYLCTLSQFLLAILVSWNFYIRSLFAVLLQVLKIHEHDKNVEIYIREMSKIAVFKENIVFLLQMFLCNNYINPEALHQQHCKYTIMYIMTMKWNACI